MVAAFLLSLLTGILNPDAFKNATEVAESYGYIHETHYVTSADGYILSMFRIRGKKGETQEDLEKRVPAILQPGIISSADNHAAGGPMYAPMFFFANKGFDLWVINERGCTYSLGHTKYSTSDKRYWNFTFEEMGRYDVPAYVEYITKTTGYSKVHYIGHSQGATQMFVALTIDPNYYSQKIISFTALGPVSAFDTTRSVPLRILKGIHFMEISEFFGVYNFGEYNSIVAIPLGFIATLFPGLARVVLSFISDEYPETMNMTRAPVFIAHYPQGGSTKNMKHLFQLMDHRGFYKYRENPSDPLVSYDFSKFPPIPIALLGGSGDLMSEPDSIMWLHNEFEKNNIKHFVKIYPLIGHLSEILPNNDNVQHFEDIYAFMKSTESGLGN